MSLVLLLVPGAIYVTPTGFRVLVRKVTEYHGIATVVFVLAPKHKKRGRPRRKQCLFSVPAREWAQLLADGTPRELRSNG